MPGVGVVEVPAELLFSGFMRRDFISLGLITGAVDLLIATRCFAVSFSGFPVSPGA